MSEPDLQELTARATDLVKRQEWTQACKVFGLIIQMNPGDPAPRYNRAIALVRLGQLELAASDLEDVLSIDPNHESAKNTLRMVNELIMAKFADESVAAPVTSNLIPEKPEVTATETKEASQVSFEEPRREDATNPVVEITSIGDKPPEIHSAQEATPCVLMPAADMNVKAGLAVWAVLTVLMLIFITHAESFGPVITFFALIAIFGIYALTVYIFLARSYKWIDPIMASPDEKRVYDAMSLAASKAGLPMPKVAIGEEDKDINVFTYGLSPGSASVVVTRPFLDHVKPTDEELAAVMAHELSHINFGDFVISALLKFPVWLMDKIRTLLHWAYALVSQISGCFAQIAGSLGWIGLAMLLVISLLSLYLMFGAFIAFLSIVLSMLFVNAFEREREYLADQFSARIMGTSAPLQSVLAKLEVAVKRIEAELQARKANAGEGEAIDLEVAPSEESLNPDLVIAEAFQSRPTFARTLASGEMFTDHPLTPHRIFLLAKPEERGRFFSSTMESAEKIADRILGRDVPSDIEGSIRGSLAVAIIIGFLLSILPAIWPKVAWLLVIVSLALGGACYGWLAGSNAWSGKTFCRRITFGSYISATTLLIVGSIANNPLISEFPIVFLMALLLYGVIGLLTSKMVHQS